jgi:hypothetical protein
MTSIISNSPLPTQRSARAAVNEYLTTYPPQWAPAILRASRTEVSRAPRPTGPIFEYPMIPQRSLAKEAQVQ